MTYIDKLIELLRGAVKEACNFCGETICKKCVYEKYALDCKYAARADYLIAHGVTVQDSKLVEIDQFNEWIPASEPPKKPGEYNVAQKHWLDGHLESKRGKWNGVEWFVDGKESLMVTHWMPLPQPPKGE